MLGIWFEVKNLLLKCKLEKLGIQQQPPYIFSLIIYQLLNELESGQETKVLGIREELLRKMVKALEVLLVCINKWDSVLETFYQKMCCCLQSYDSRRTLHLVLQKEKQA